MPNRQSVAVVLLLEALRLGQVAYQSRRAEPSCVDAGVAEERAALAAQLCQAQLAGCQADAVCGLPPPSPACAACPVLTYPTPAPAPEEAPPVGLDAPTWWTVASAAAAPSLAGYLFRQALAWRRHRQHAAAEAEAILGRERPVRRGGGVIE